MAAAVPARKSTEAFPSQKTPTAFFRALDSGSAAPRPPQHPSPTSSQTRFVFTAIFLNCAFHKTFRKKSQEMRFRGRRRRRVGGREGRLAGGSQLWESKSFIIATC